MNDKKSIRLIVFALLALFIITSFQSERMLSQELRIKALEKVLKGDKYLCSVKRKIKNTHINCDQLKNTQEQGK